ncbi:MAG: winged helix-turn-helix domain-containing protein [Acidianus sp.]|uniref:winged helix-turn-helix domain-containing protein n=1 Tax=Acidianus sp. TaxID=1872104 RepID=UPI00397D19ED
MINMVKERDLIPMYRILAFLNKKKEVKTINEISKEINMSYSTTWNNTYKLLALGAIEIKDEKYIITEKGKQMLDEFIKEIEKLKELVDSQ